MRRGDASGTDANGGRASEIPAERGPLVFLSGNMGRRSLSRCCGRRAGDHLHGTHGMNAFPGGAEVKYEFRQVLLSSLCQK